METINFDVENEKKVVNEEQEIEEKKRKERNVKKEEEKKKEEENLLKELKSATQKRFDKCETDIKDVLLKIGELEKNVGESNKNVFLAWEQLHKSMFKYLGGEKPENAKGRKTGMLALLQIIHLYITRMKGDLK